MSKSGGSKERRGRRGIKLRRGRRGIKERSDDKGYVGKKGERE